MLPTTIRPCRAVYSYGEIVILCSDGDVVSFKASLNPILRDTSFEDINNIECTPFGLHWPTLNEDLSLDGILQGRYNKTK